MEIGRHHSHDGVKFVVEFHGLPKRADVAGEPALPEIVAENHDAVLAELHLLLSEIAADGGLAAHHVEEDTRHAAAAQTFSLSAARQVEASAAERRKPAEAVILV